MPNEFQIKRPSFIIFTDKDGTLNLEDKKLDNILKLIISMNGLVIPVTGRTVGDILESLKKNHLKIPEILVGDNGANIYSTSRQQFLIKKTLDNQKVKTLIDDFIATGGKQENIRLTDGSLIYAIDTPDVRKYYEKSKSVKYLKDIQEALENMPEITKITLAGTQEQMQQMSTYSQKMDFWSDIGATKFPNADYKHYRLDIADKNINKGEAVKLISTILKPPHGYICIGNGENDISMFKQSIDNGMMIGIMEDSPEAIKTEMKAYADSKHKRQNYYYP